MRVTALLLAAVLACAGRAAAAGVDVRVRGEQVDVHATAAPLADILDRLARETGMKVVYEGSAPRQLLTATLDGRTPAEAVLGLLEGTGLNYAVVMDKSGARVDTLLMAGVGGPGAPAAPFGSPAPAPVPEPPRPRGPGPHVQPADAAEAEAEAQAEEEEPQAEEEEGATTKAEGAPEHAAPAPIVPPNAGFPSSPFAPQPVFPGAPAAATPAPSPHPGDQPPKEEVE